MPSQPDTPNTEAVNEPPRFEFKRFAVNKVLFEHLPRATVSEGETKPGRVPYHLQIGAGIQVLADGTAEVSLGVTVTPDPKWVPYRIEVEVVGRFSTVNGTPQQLQQFCQYGAPPILFPYVREVVHRLTTDGKYGVLRLHPINIQELLTSAKWVGPTTDPELLPRLAE